MFNQLLARVTHLDTMPRDRHEQKEELLCKLGRLFGPVQDLIARGPDATSDERTRVLARYSAEYEQLITTFREFSTSEPGHDYRAQYNQFHNAVYGFANQAATSPDQIDSFLNVAVATAKEALRSIPVSADSVIFETNTPFSTYCKLKTLCNLAQTRITFVDRFLDQSVFYRYLRDVGDDVVITLIGPRRALTDAFLDVSSLFAHERGSDKYRLVSVPYRGIHDRWLHVDNELYQLGNSTAHAAMLNDFTISHVDATPENLSRVTDKITSGTQQYGPTQTNHPNQASDLL